MLTTSEFKPAFWLRNPHAQTLFASQARKSPPLTVAREQLELDDGDFLDLSWLPESDQADNAPLVVVLHGLAGSLESKYARGLLRQVAAHGGRGLLMHFRGASRPNRLERSYHSGETGDLRFLLKTLQARYPHAPLAAVGYSLGANVLLKYLGEQGATSPLSCAAAVSVPFQLEICARAIQRGFARIYQAHLLKGMRAVVAAKTRAGAIQHPLPDLDRLHDFPSFDDAVTAPLNGFADAQDYYTRASCRPFLGAIRTPTLILHAQDDPFMTPKVIPAPEELSAAIRMELSSHGGHVGFVAAGRPYGAPLYWLEQRIPAYLGRHLPRFAPAGEGQPMGETG
jgi:predicted alpha/beta-fold hydrolase